MFSDTLLWEKAQVVEGPFYQTLSCLHSYLVIFIRRVSWEFFTKLANASTSFVPFVCFLIPLLFLPKFKNFHMCGISSCNKMLSPLPSMKPLLKYIYYSFLSSNIELYPIRLYLVHFFLVNISKQVGINYKLYIKL